MSIAWYIIFKYHSLLHILRFLFFSSDNIMADVASKQQTTALFLFTIVTHTRWHTELTKKLTTLMGNLCCAREHSVQFFVQFFLHSYTAQFNLQCIGPLRLDDGQNRFWSNPIFITRFSKKRCLTRPKLSRYSRTDWISVLLRRRHTPKPSKH